MAPSQHAERVVLNSPELALNHAAASALPIMVFVGSPGFIQIHTGPVVRIETVRLGAVEVEHADARALGRQRDRDQGKIGMASGQHVHDGAHLIHQ